jgi:hypothetical protein
MTLRLLALPRLSALVRALTHDLCGRGGTTRVCVFVVLVHFVYTFNAADGKAVFEPKKAPVAPAIKAAAQGKTLNAVAAAATDTMVRPPCLEDTYTAGKDTVLTLGCGAAPHPPHRPTRMRFKLVRRTARRAMTRTMATRTRVRRRRTKRARTRRAAQRLQRQSACPRRLSWVVGSTRRGGGGDGGGRG